MVSEGERVRWQAGATERAANSSPRLQRLSLILLPLQVGATLMGCTSALWLRCAPQHHAAAQRRVGPTAMARCPPVWLCLTCLRWSSFHQLLMCLAASQHPPGAAATHIANERAQQQQQQQRKKIKSMEGKNRSHTHAHTSASLDLASLTLNAHTSPPPSLSHCLT